MKTKVRPSGCVHHWQCPSLPTNGVFLSRCKLCGAARGFDAFAGEPNSGFTRSSLKERESRRRGQQRAVEARWTR